MTIKRLSASMLKWHRSFCWQRRALLTAGQSHGLLTPRQDLLGYLETEFEKRIPT